MATVLNGNSEAGFIFASMTEFIHLWRSGKEASIKIDCKDKQAFLNISCSLGHPDQPHIPVVKRRKKKKGNQMLELLVTGPELPAIRKLKRPVRNQRQRQQLRRGLLPALWSPLQRGQSLVCQSEIPTPAPQES